MDIESEEQPSLRELVRQFQNLAIYLRSNIIDASYSMETRNLSRDALEDFLNVYSEMAEVYDLMNYVFESGTVLQMAARYGRDDLIPLFIRYGADPNFRPEGGLSAVEVAIWYDNWAVLGLFIPNRTNASTDEAVIVWDPFELALAGLRDDLGIAGDSSR